MTVRNRSRYSLPAVAVAVLIATGACGGNDTPSSTSKDTPEFPPTLTPYEPNIDPADFVEGIDNPYLPLEPGTTYTYKGMSEGEAELNTVSVTTETKEIMGITCTVVLDIVKSEGGIGEKTFDWYAQDRFGNVWYFGEDSTSYENGKPESSEGSWEAGVDGAQPGIVMLGDPSVGDRYRQEYYAGEAEDMAEVLRLDASAEVPFGSFDNVLVTEDLNPLEPKVLENKFYARGIGVVLEKHVKGPSEINRLVDMKRH